MAIELFTTDKYVFVDLKFLLSRFQTNKAYKRVWIEAKERTVLLLLLFKPHSFRNCYDEYEDYSSSRMEELLQLPS